MADIRQSTVFQFCKFLHIWHDSCSWICVLIIRCVLWWFCDRRCRNCRFVRVVYFVVVRRNVKRVADPVKSGVIKGLEKSLIKNVAYSRCSSDFVLVLLMTIIKPLFNIEKFSSFALTFSSYIWLTYWPLSAIIDFPRIHLNRSFTCRYMSSATRTV